MAPPGFVGELGRPRTYGINLGVVLNSLVDSLEHASGQMAASWSDIGSSARSGAPEPLPAVCEPSRNTVLDERDD